MKMYLINFIRAYIGDHGEIHSKYRVLEKRVIFFSTGDQSYENKCFIFQFLAGANFHVCTLSNSKVTDLWPHPLEYYSKLVLTTCNN